MTESTSKACEYTILGFVTGKQQHKRLKTIAGGLIILILVVMTNMQSMLSVRGGSQGMVTLDIKGVPEQLSLLTDHNTESIMVQRHLAVDTKLLLGIFSTDTPESAERRQMIRDTYLTVNRSDKLRDPRVCSLLEYENKGMHKYENCIVLYVFVIGGIPVDYDRSGNIPTEHIFGAERDMTIDHSKELHTMMKEDDVVYLNIKENENSGKTSTFFKWASKRNHRCENRKSACVHYIAKVDDDTMIYMPALFDKIVYTLPPHPYNTRIYGGKKTDFYECGMSEYCKSAVPHGYMKGSFYFLSTDLARDVTYYNYPQKYAKEKEDFDMGRWVFSNVQRTKMPVSMIASGSSVLAWLPQPITDKDEWTRLWHGYEHDGIPYICAEGYGDPDYPC